MFHMPLGRCRYAAGAADMRGRQYVCDHYGWEATLGNLDAMFSRGVAVA